MSATIIDRIKQVRPLDKAAAEQARAHIDQLTKPPGSLGRLEELAILLAGMTGDPFPDVVPPGVLVFAGDHGIVEEGVSAFPQEVTKQMVYNFVRGGAAINVFARQIGALLRVVDVGVAADLETDGVWKKKVRYGTANFLREHAMTREEAHRCVEAGMEAAETIVAEGARLLIIGEMGIGNTTASSAMLAALTGADAEAVVGRGTGISDQAWQHKVQVVKEALAARKPDLLDPLDVLEKVGGLEIGAMAGAVIGAASRQVPVLVDGFISTVAALLAVRLCSDVRDYLIVGHRSIEPGHAFVLRLLDKQPLLDLNLRLGEGSGAAVAFPIVEASARMIREMATFASAGVTGHS
jgi:nicotinate-nucleotide--dimethylbenzimidazole phosphoribosyltransferase